MNYKAKKSEAAPSRALAEEHWTLGRGAATIAPTTGPVAAPPEANDDSFTTDDATRLKLRDFPVTLRD